MKIKASKELWKKHEEVMFRVKNLNSIIQNDINLGPSDIEWWKDSVRQSVKDLWQWHKEVLEHINGPNEPGK